MVPKCISGYNAACFVRVLIEGLHGMGFNDSRGFKLPISLYKPQKPSEMAQYFHYRIFKIILKFLTIMILIKKQVNEKFGNLQKIKIRFKFC